MKKLLVFATLFFFTPYSAFAFEVVVRSGEHAGFTRLVLDLPSRLDWELEHTGRNAEIRLRASDLTFDTSNAFTRITRDRIVALKAGSKSNSFQLELNCDCEIRVSPGSNNMLIVDVIGTPDLKETMAASISESSVIGSEVSNPRVGFNLPHTGYSLFLPTSDARLPSLEPVSEFHLGFGSFLGNSNGGDTNHHAEMEATIERSQNINNAEQRLIGQIARAATQGLLTVPEPHLTENETHNNTRSIPTPFPKNPPASNPSPTMAENVNLKAESSIDREQADNLGMTPQTMNGEDCLSQADLAIQNWGGSTPFGSQLGPLRAHLVGEFDKLDAETANKLIKLYLHFGFDAEATQTLELVEHNQNDSNVLASMARILDLGFDPYPNEFDGLLECNSDAAFWSFLSKTEIPSDQQINTSAILRTLSALPVHLRSYLGPILSQRMVRAGETDTAKSILRIIERGTDRPNPQTQMAIASLELAENNMEDAADSLNDAVSSSTEISPKALVQLVETLLNQSKPIPPHLADLAGAYVQERRGHPISQDLHRTQILILASTADFSKAMQELEKFEPTGSQTEYQSLRSGILAILTEQSDDLTFLELILPHSKKSPETLDVSTGDNIAQRLLELGFADLASRFLVSENNTSVGPERRILLAKLALSHKRPRRAEAEIIGMSGHLVDTLRAKARSMTGDHLAAQSLFSNLHENQSTESQAWLAGNWAHLANSKEPNIAAAAQLMIKEETLSSDALPSAADTDPSASTAGVLAQNYSLLKSSSGTRETLTALLETMSVNNKP